MPTDIRPGSVTLIVTISVYRPPLMFNRLLRGHGKGKGTPFSLLSRAGIPGHVFDGNCAKSTRQRHLNVALNPVSRARSSLPSCSDGRNVRFSLTLLFAINKNCSSLVVEDSLRILEFNLSQLVVTKVASLPRRSALESVVAPPL